MILEEYQELAMRTSDDGHNRVLNGCMGLIGESGEIVDIVKKWSFQSGDNPPLPVKEIVEECGDVLWYCAELSTALNEDLASIYKDERMLLLSFEPPKEEKLEVSAIRLAVIAMEPARLILHNSSFSETDFADRSWIKSSLKISILSIMTTIRDILETHCKTSLYKAMEYNIEKLRRRYPDGFDPERSLHRIE